MVSLIVQSADSSLRSGGDERLYCHLWRIHLVSFGDGRILQNLVFSICKAVTAFDRWVASNVERFDNALPQKAALKYFYHCCRADVSRDTTNASFHSALDVEDPVGHRSTICTRRQTVQSEWATLDDHCGPIGGRFDFCRAAKLSPFFEDSELGRPLSYPSAP